MKLTTRLSALFTLVCLLFIISACSERMDSADEECDIVDFEVELLYNEGLYPIPAQGRSVKKETVMLRLDFQADFANTTSTPQKLQDDLTSIRIIAKTDIGEGMPAGTDLTPYFYIKNKGMDELVSFSFDSFFYLPLDLVLFLVPNAGEHEFEVIATFESGREIIKSTEVITLI